MILVTGATGRLGRTVATLLRQASFPTRCLVRRGSATFLLNGTGAALYFGDLKDPASLRRACAGVTGIVACSGLTWEARGNDHDTVTWRGHADLWRAAADQGVQRVVLVSCLTVGRGGRSAASLARFRAEQALLDVETDHVILRPSLFVEDLVRLARAAFRPVGLTLPGNGRAPVSPVCLRDVALHAITALDHPALSRRTVELGGPEALPIAQALERAAGALQAQGAAGVGPDHQPRVTWLPDALVRAGLPGLGLLSRREHHRWQELVQTFTADLSVDPTTFAPDFHLPLTPLADALAMAVREASDGADVEALRRRVAERPAAAAPYTPGIVSGTERR